MMQVLLTCAIQILQVKQLKFQSNVTVYQLHGCHKKSDKATVKSYEQGKFQDTIVLTMADKIAGTEVSSISNVVEGGFSSVAGWQPRSVENQAPTITSAVEGNRKL